MESYCPSHKAVLDILEIEFPDRPFLALGQTAFWDEPMKVGVALCSESLGFKRPFVAGVHETDYFAKHPGTGDLGTYASFPHNDTTTKDLWSAAGEFSAVFGSETVITKERVLRAGSKLARVERGRPKLFDQMSEAFGWRGVAYVGDNPPITAETRMEFAGRALLETLDWAIDETLDCVAPCQAELAKQQAQALRTLACDAACAPEVNTVGDFYERALKPLYNFVAGKEAPIRTSRTSELLKLNKSTFHQPRFKLLSAFLDPATRDHAKKAYDQAVAGTEVYGLDRFGSWAVPFDLVIPGIGRGTLRIAPRAILVMTPTPVCITTKKPITSLKDFAEAIEKKFGPDCTVVGKAVSLIGMLAEEFVFVFHEGASSYVQYSRAFHQRLIEQGISLNPSPILRVKYQTWKSLEHCNMWLRLPEPLRRPFGTDDLSTKSFSTRIDAVQAEQQELLKQLSALRSPLELIRFLAERYSQSWKQLASQYEDVHQNMEQLETRIQEIRAKKQSALQAWRAAKHEVNRLQHEKGKHWREAIFEKDPTQEDWDRREAISQQISEASDASRAALQVWKALQKQQDKLVSEESVLRDRERRRTLELEAEVMRLRLIREAVTTTDGLRRASNRPSAWWFPLVCSDGGWFAQTVNTAEFYLEPLR